MNEKREDGPRIGRLLSMVDGGAPPPDVRDSEIVHLPAEEMFKINEKLKAIGDAPEGDTVDLGPVHYAEKLHESGEAATQIVANMCEAEFAGGNPRNIPEPIIGWYVMTLAYQLCVMEAVNMSPAAISDHVGQLNDVRRVFKRYETPYGDGVREEVRTVLRDRRTYGDKDGTYGGTLLP